MKTQEFIRLRRVATENGWSIEQVSIPDSSDTVAIFKKTVEKEFGDPVEREVRVFFEIEEDQTIVKNCYYNGREIRMSQVRNALENL